ncbi:MAG: AbrB/MazE/SpoVT family DNA-binding domain-containing protein [Alphaproteobacteria bacterium]|nr:AbrB/MazE/SpoVT family DNA-binding domain-containing protein [Alphaproteobacteria bacterium]
MNETMARLGESGRLVIPASFRKAMGIKPGDDVMLRVDGDELHILSVEKSIQRAKDAVKRYAKGQSSLADQLIAERREEQLRG